MKKLLTILLLMPLMLNPMNLAFSNEAEDIGELKKFYVTAYYSPLPDQQFYLRGNFEDEVKLNGEGKHGASGKAVHPGMLAAPKTYPFGTRLYLEGVGIGTVEDRGGAIVGSGSRGYDADRIDVWMGYGDEGLKRALTWGKRAVYGRILSRGDEGLPSIEVENFKIGNINYDSLKNASLVGKNTGIKTEKTVTAVNIVPQTIVKTNPKDTIIQAQKIFKELGFFNGDLNGVFSPNLKVAILTFQIDSGIVKNAKSKGAGVYGPATKKALSERYMAFLNEEKIKLAKENMRIREIAAIETKVTSITASMGIPKVNEVGSHVRKLQKALKLLGFFQDKDTAIYGMKTKESILNYQISKGLVSTATDPGAGLIGERTLARIKEDLKNLAITNKEIIKSLES